MRSGISPINSAVASRNTLALAIAAVAQSDGDYTTAIPALSLHRRNMPTAPMHCIYGLGLGVVAQGGKQVMLGGDRLWARPIDAHYRRSAGGSACHAG
jgi:AraC-type transcriptional regulator